MFPVYRFLLPVLLLMPICATGQAATPELPLPAVPGVGIVVKVRHSFLPPEPGLTRPSRDTESVFLLNREGYAHTRYFSDKGYCTGKETYGYSEGRLTRLSTYRTLTKHLLFAPPALHTHQLQAEQTWEYRGGRVSVARYFAGSSKVLTHEIRYTYDRQGRVDYEQHRYPEQVLVVYPKTYDFVQYSYFGDSVIRESYQQGQKRDSVAYVERRDQAGRLTERYLVAPDSRHFEREIRRYDTAGRLMELESYNELAPVAEDGSVRRIDKVDFIYDAQGRPDEERYSARYIRRWAYKYGYLK